MSESSTLASRPSAGAHRCLQIMHARDRAPVVGLYFVDETHALSGTTRGALQVWDTVEGTSREDLQGHRGRIVSIAATAAGSMAASVDERGHLRLWDLATLRCVVHLDYSDHDRFILQHMSLCNDGAWALTTDGGARAFVWDLHRGALARQLEVGLEGRLLGSVLGSPQQAWLRLKDESWVALSLDGDGPPVPAPAPAPELAYRGRSPLYRAWLQGERVIVRDRATGRDLVVLEGHEQPVLSATATPDASRMLSGDAGGVIRLWELDWR